MRKRRNTPGSFETPLLGYGVVVLAAVLFVLFLALLMTITKVVAG